MKSRVYEKKEIKTRNLMCYVESLYMHENLPSIVPQLEKGPTQANHYKIPHGNITVNIFLFPILIEKRNDMIVQTRCSVIPIDSFYASVKYM